MGASLASARADAYRCTADSNPNAILDPCFVAGDVLVCVEDPTQATPGTKLSVAELPEANPATDETRPWFVELADGTMCGFLTGATGGVGDERLNYGCTDQTYILGDPVPGEPWTAERVTMGPGSEGGPPAPTSQETVPLARVWR
jgi:hypothetical protein